MCDNDPKLYFPEFTGNPVTENFPTATTSFFTSLPPTETQSQTTIQISKDPTPKVTRKFTENASVAQALDKCGLPYKTIEMTNDGFPKMKEFLQSRQVLFSQRSVFTNYFQAKSKTRQVWTGWFYENDSWRNNFEANENTDAVLEILNDSIRSPFEGSCAVVHYNIVLEKLGTKI